MEFASSAEPLRRFVAKMEARSTLSGEERDALLGLPAVVRDVPVHRDVAPIRERGDHVCLVADGYVARFALLGNGDRQIVSLHLAGDIVDLSSLMLSSQPRPLVALSHATVLHIPHAALLALTSRFPEIATAFWRECAVDNAIMTQWLVNVGRQNARGRLAHLLCEMAIRSNQIGRLTSDRYPFPVTQEQMADVLGLTPVHVNRMMQSLRKDGFLHVSRGEVVILDWEGLVTTGEFNPDYLHLPSRWVDLSRVAAHR